MSGLVIDTKEKFQKKTEKPEEKNEKNKGYGGLGNIGNKIGSGFWALGNKTK